MIRRFAPRVVSVAAAPTSCTPLAMWHRYCLSIAVPTIAESVSTGKIQTWHKKVGDEVEEDTVICSIESDKATVDVRAPKSGTITKIAFEEGATVNVGDEIASLKEGEVSASAGSSDAAAADTTKAEEKKGDAAATAKDEKKEAAKKKEESSKPAAASKPAASSGAPKEQTVTVAGSDPRTRHVRVSMMRQRIADRLKASQNTAALLTTFNEIDMTPLMKLREKYKDDFMKKHGVKLGFMSPFAKACAIALQDVPIVNASWGNDTIEYHDFVDISIAVSTPTGLVVPVLRDVQDMNLAQIEKKIEDFGTRARERTITIPEMTGGTFTISNGGTFGSWMGTPIVNPPQSAILGMHAIKKKPWVVNDQIVIRDIMAVALTYDHRIIDGRDAVTFLVKVKNLIEDPTRMVLDLA